MESTHTPGPWVYRDEEIHTEDGQVHVVCFGHGYGDYGGIGGGDEQANAHLIAAAPDLLAALETIVAHIPATELDHWNVLDVIDRAIAKATGR